MNVGDGLLFGCGRVEAADSDDPPSLPSYGAMFAAVSFDADFAEAEKVVRHLFAERVKRADFKTEKTTNRPAKKPSSPPPCPCPNTALKNNSVMPTDSMFLISCDLGESSASSTSLQGLNHKVAEQQLPEKRCNGSSNTIL